MKDVKDQKTYDRMMFYRLMPLLLILLFLAVTKDCTAEIISIQSWVHHGTWVCPRCGHHNYNEDNPCPVCAEPKPSKRGYVNPLYTKDAMWKFPDDYFVDPIRVHRPDRDENEEECVCDSCEQCNEMPKVMWKGHLYQTILIEHDSECRCHISNQN